MRRKKVTYPVAKTSRRGAPFAADDPRNPSARIVAINLDAMTGRKSIGRGDRVRILSGLYEGEAAVVESVVGGVIPAAVVRTQAGRARRARTIDLEPLREPPAAGQGPTT